jgi:DNA-binding transcriptional ArsR family regulator
MKDGPNISRVAALLGDPARADVLTALLTDRALTATELAEIAGVTKQTMSAHLSKLLAAALVVVDQQGRHRYFRLADQDVAALLESLMGVAFRTGAVRLISSPREPALRNARICYDHLAGELGVRAYEGLLQLRVLEMSQEGLRLTESGVEWFAHIGVDAEATARQRRTFCRPCLDWSERRYHLAGALGAAMLSRFCHLGWALRDNKSRAIRFSPQGERELQTLFKTNTVRNSKNSASMGLGPSARRTIGGSQTNRDGRRTAN